MTIPNEVSISKVEMLIRKPVKEVFDAFINPSITAKFWFTKSSGKLEAGKRIRWDWEMYGVSGKVRVKEVEDMRRIRFEWVEDKPTTVQLRFVPWREDATYVQITETGFSGDGDELVSRVTDSTGGYYQVLCALKALLEHNVVLTVVLDNNPPEGLEL